MTRACHRARTRDNGAPHPRSLCARGRSGNTRVVTGRPRHEYLEQVFEAIGSLPTQWFARLSVRDDAALLADTLWLAWTRGHLESVCVASSAPRAARDLHRTLTALFNAASKVVVKGSPIWVPPVDRLTSERVVPSEAVTRRWCWIDGWILLPQDEDALLSDVEALLEEALAECPKRWYALRIAEGEMRRHTRFTRVESLARMASQWLPLLEALQWDPTELAKLRALSEYPSCRDRHGERARLTEMLGRDPGPPPRRL